VELGPWIAQQRQAWASGRLEADRAKRLADLPGWSWQPHAEAWEAMYGALEAFVGREGHARVPKVHVEVVTDAGGDRHELALGAWVSRHRKLIAGDKLEAGRAQRLTGLPGWSNDLRVERWDAGLDALGRFVAREGHARVPQQHREGTYLLGSWVGSQRARRAAGRLPADRARLLETFPGWLWDTNASAWQRGFEVLQAYVARTGTARVRYDHYEDGFDLGQWCDVQRSGWRRGTLARDRAELVEALPGWVWDVRSAKWEEAYEVLCRHVARTGDSAVPRASVEEGVALGNWVRVQRRSFHDGSIDPSRIPRLEALQGWSWGPNGSSSRFCTPETAALAS
jgi:hypothetical protein